MSGRQHAQDLRSMLATSAAEAGARAADARRHAALLAVYEAKAAARGEAVARARNRIEEFAGGDGELFRLEFHRTVFTRGSAAGLRIENSLLFSACAVHHFAP